MFLLFIINIVANPFSIVSKLDKINYASDEYYKFDITVRSISRQEGGFLLNLELPKSIELLEGNSTYKDNLINQVQKTFTLIINPLKEEEGEIKIKLYSYLDENIIDKAKVKTFSISYLIFKHNDALILKTNDAVEVFSKKDKTKNIKEENLVLDKDLNSDSLEVNIETETTNNQTFVYVKEAKKLTFYKVLLLFISLGILVYFIRRILKNKSY